jgi:hypothetical protein
MIVAGGLAGLLLLPLAVATARAIDTASSTAYLGTTVNHSANLIAYLLPQELHPWWGDAIHQWRRAALWEPVTAGMMALGLSLLGLALIGLIGSWPATRLWLVVLLTGLGLALGPELYIGHTAYDLPTPFALFSQLLPYLTVSRNPARFVLIASLGLAVLAACGTAWLGRRRPFGWSPGWLTGLAAGLVLFELWPAPFALSPPPDSQVDRLIAAELAGDDRATVLTLPYKADEQYVLYHQVQHGRPIYSTGGAISRLPDPPLRRQTVGFTDLMLDRPYRDFVESAPAPVEALNHFHVRYVLYLPLEAPERDRARYRQALRRVTGQAAPRYRSADGSVEAWAVPVVPLTRPLLRVGDGWYRVESWPGIGTGRWLRGDGVLWVERPASMAVQVDFTAISFVRPRRLTVHADGHLLATVPIGTTPTPVSLTLPTGEGRLRLELEAIEGVSRQDQLDFEDKRQLTIGLANVRITPVP